MEPRMGNWGGKRKRASWESLGGECVRYPRTLFKKIGLYPRNHLRQRNPEILKKIKIKLKISNQGTLSLELGNRMPPGATRRLKLSRMTSNLFKVKGLICKTKNNKMNLNQKILKNQTQYSQTYKEAKMNGNQMISKKKIFKNPIKILIQITNKLETNLNKALLQIETKTQVKKKRKDLHQKSPVILNQFENQMRNKHIA